MITIGINGFGRIGRLVFRAAQGRNDVSVVAINHTNDIEYLEYLLKYDSVHGRFGGEISIDKKTNTLTVDGDEIRLTTFRNPEDIKWGEVGVDVVVDATGVFLTKDTARRHIIAGAKKVILSAPPKDDTPMFVMGVNHTEISSEDTIVSNASCTTNCLAPIAKIIHQEFGIVEGLMTTIHSATGKQRVIDASSPNDWRAGRSALNNIIPSTTGAAKSVGKVIPELNGKLTGVSFRIPTPNVSVVDFTVRVDKSTSYEEVKRLIKHRSENDFKGIVSYTEDAVVSQDFVGDPHTSIFDAHAGLALSDKFMKLVMWYDNEVGYSHKILDIIGYMNSAG